VGASPLLLANCDPAMTQNTLFSSLGYGFGDLPSRYPQNTYAASKPHGVVMRWRRNVYESGRAQVAVYNWDHQAEVALDLASAGLQAGDTYEIRTAQDFYGPPLQQGVYLGLPVRLSMQGHTVAPPVGTVPRLPQPTDPEFGAFVILRTSPR
jgi:hypothetical protein